MRSGETSMPYSSRRCPTISRVLMPWAYIEITVKDVPEGHICCGSAGTYNILQPELAHALRARKVPTIQPPKPALIAPGNIGCITQIGRGPDIPIVHTVELL